MIFCEKFLQKIKISLRRDVEKLISRKRYFCLFVCLCVFISAIKLPRIPTYYLKNSFAFSKSSVTASPSAMGKPYPQIVQDIFLSPFLFFIYPICRILPAAKHDAGLRATQTPRAKLAAWIASQNYVLLFSQHLQARQSHHTFRSSRQLSFAHSRPTPFRPIFYRAPHFPAPTTSLPAPAGNSPSPHIFPY